MSKPSNVTNGKELVTLSMISVAKLLRYLIQRAVMTSVWVIMNLITQNLICHSFDQRLFWSNSVCNRWSKNTHICLHSFGCSHDTYWSLGGIATSSAMLPPMTYAHLHLLPSETSRFAFRRQSDCFFYSWNGTINSWTKADRAGLNEHDLSWTWLQRQKMYPYNNISAIRML